MLDPAISTLMHDFVLTPVHCKVQHTNYKSTKYTISQIKPVFFMELGAVINHLEIFLHPSGFIGNTCYSYPGADTELNPEGANCRCAKAPPGKGQGVLLEQNPPPLYPPLPLQLSIIIHR